MIYKILQKLFGSSGSDEGPSQEEVLDEYEDEDGLIEQEKSNLREGSKREKADGESAVPDISEYHKNLIAPMRIDEEPTQVTVGEHKTRTIFINQWPDNPSIGFLEGALMDTDVVNDVTIHMSPYRTEQALDDLEDDYRKAEALARGDSGGSLINKRDQERDYEQTRNVFEALRQTNAKLFDVSMYITLRGETDKELEVATEEMVKHLRTSPAFTKPEVPKRQQLKAFQSVSPILDDKLGYSNEMLGGAIGAMYPFSSKSFIEPGGIDYGIHAGNESPVIINRFEERQTGYNQLTFGKIGSGKSFGTKLEILRSYISRDDIKIVMLDPLGGFDSVNAALGGEKIVVGGTLGLNPLEIQKTPEGKRNEDIDPYGMAKQKAMDFFDMYFHKRGTELGSIRNGRGILERAVDRAYRQNDIYPDDFESHGNDAPTVLDVRDILIDMQENPKKYSKSEGSTINENNIEQAASEVAISFEQFSEGGEYHNLAKDSEIDLYGNDVHYVDLQQREGSSKRGLMMHLLLSEVYEAAKRHDGKTLFVIDEAHLLLQDAKSIDFLEQVVRHSRHEDLGINFITQTIEEFYKDEQAQKIAQMCSIKKFHRVETGLDADIRKQIGITQKEEHYIRTAEAGSEEVNYSQALVGIGSKGFVPTLVVPSEAEKAIIDYDPSEEDLDEVTEEVKQSS